MKTLVLGEKSIFLYEDGSIRIYSRGAHLCLDRQDIELISKQVKKVLELRKATHKNTDGSLQL